MGCLRIWCAYCMLKIWKSKCMKYLRYLPTIVVCRSIIFVTAGINSPFTVCGMFCWSKTKLPNSVSSSCWAQVFVCVPPSLFKVFCSLSPPVPHCSVSSPPLPLSLETHGGKKQEKALFLPFHSSQTCCLLLLPTSSSKYSNFIHCPLWTLMQHIWHTMTQRKSQHPSFLLHSMSLGNDCRAGQCDK